MKHLCKPICILLFVIMAAAVNYVTAQQPTYGISGIVTDDKGTPMPSATVFLSGTKSITATDLQGRFHFYGLAPGTYQLMVSMLGFEAYAQTVTLKDGSVTASIVLKVKATDLREVVINPNERARNYALFKDAFLGRTENARSCLILNPEVISFYNDRQKGKLTAEASELLTIENKRLGYRIKYLLKDFDYDLKDGIVLYNGETSFEELAGKNTEKKKWQKNRAETYKNSMMHFLRSVYRKDLLAEGYIAYNIFLVPPKPGGLRSAVQADPLPADFTKLVTAIDTSFVSFKFKDLYVMYDPAKATKLLKQAKAAPADLNGKGSILRLMRDEAIVDRRGSYPDHKTFYLHGIMAEKRVGDQLPFEYQP